MSTTPVGGYNRKTVDSASLSYVVRFGQEEEREGGREMEEKEEGRSGKREGGRGEEKRTRTERGQEDKRKKTETCSKENMDFTFS